MLRVDHFHAGEGRLKGSRLDQTSFSHLLLFQQGRILISHFPFSPPLPCFHIPSLSLFLCSLSLRRHGADSDACPGCSCGVHERDNDGRDNGRRAVVHHYPPCIDNVFFHVNKFNEFNDRRYLCKRRERKHMSQGAEKGERRKKRSLSERQTGKRQRQKERWEKKRCGENKGRGKTVIAHLHAETHRNTEIVRVRTWRWRKRIKDYSQEETERE